MVTAADVRELVDERPALEDAVEAVVEAEEPFAFDDLDIDSGAFGEVVSTGVVEKTDDGYRVADREAVRRGLAGETGREPTESGTGLATPSLDINLMHALALAGALAFVVLLRTVFSVGPVFQDSAVVLSGNDPYYYRYWVEQLLANPDLTVSSLPGAVAKGEPLYVATMWLLASVLGGEAVAGSLLAWYPVVSALVSGALVYLLATEVTEDRRVGLAAVVMFAVVAGHALRTSLGFADHHAFDYPWLGVTALSLVALVRGELRSGRTVFGTLGLAVGVTGQVLAWEAGPLLVVPVGLAVATLAVVWVRADRSPLRSGAPMLVGQPARAHSRGWPTRASAGTRPSSRRHRHSCSRGPSACSSSANSSFGYGRTHAWPRERFSGRGR
ncbi:STT3 domain-containing protein [Halosegnis marinus]|uniref:STT3 domain-containing protein n=1 Tax=Halosegnis marinus TaxID=3034023 RepID=UPI003621E4BB